MKFEATAKLKKKILNIVLSTVIILTVYTVFRVTLGTLVVHATDNKIAQLMVEYSGSGISLTEIQSKKLGELSDTRSGLNGSVAGTYLTGSTGLKTSNPKILAMQKFLLDYNSPMHAYSDVLVNEAEKYGLDWRLVASISGVESAFGNLIPYQSNNGWGWRGGPGGAYSIFPTWKEGIETVTQRLALGYGTDLTPFQIEPAYCPPCYANPAHAWANGVTKFMNELSFYLENLENI